jgi:hypothetical protein
MDITYIKSPKNITNVHKIYHMSTKYTKCPQNIPNVHKIYQMSTKYTNRLHSKIHPNLDFWYANVASGNPVPAAFDSAERKSMKKFGFRSGVTHGGGDRQGGPLGVALEEPPSLGFHPPPHGLG